MDRDAPDGRHPLPARLDPRQGREPAERGARAGRSRWAAVLGRTVAAVLAALLLTGSGWGWYLVRVAEAGVNRTDAIPAGGNSDVHGADHAGAEVNLLLVGMDTRTGLTPEQQAQFNTGNPDDVLNTDSMMLAHVPADGSGASVVSLPRDTYVPIPGHGEGRLNSAYARGYNSVEGTDAEKDAAGAQLLVQTVSGLSGLRIDHFAEIDLLGFIDLSTIVGGVQVNLCQATSDSLSGADFPAGVQTISGPDALAFVRQRHGLPRYDLDRVVRQQVYLGGMLRNVLSREVLLSPSRQKEVVEHVAGSVTVDRGLDVFDLAAQLQGVRPGALTFQTLPGLTPERIDGAEVLQLPGQEVVHAFFGSLAAAPAAAQDEPRPATPDVAPGDVTVSVLNGSGVSGAAATAAGALADAGFQAGSGGNATGTATTTVGYRSGDDAAAALVAAQVPGAALAVDDGLPAGTVQLVLGTDFNGIGVPDTSRAPAAGDPRPATAPGCIN